jgi:hypothetical protein
MNEPRLLSVLGVALGLAVCAGCDTKPTLAPTPPAAAETAPDRLQAGESLPEAETAFGLPLPPGMKLTRHFTDSAYFTGELPVEKALEHVQANIEARDLEMMRLRTVISRAFIKGDKERRLVRIEVSKLPRGSQIYIKDITPPPAIGRLSEAELWQRAGRKPDGTLLDPNKVY